ncbi:MAG: AAA family ATPase [Ruminococcaceae bacterium]|nr:AAA family ATPase [Oscillospiraceae bacterium]
MNSFDKVIGYDTIKEELLQICDMFHNKDIYEKLGAKIPCGVLLHGNPGLGKSLMAKCFIEESGFKVYTLRKNKGERKFVEYISKVFEEAKSNAPCIIFLDDVDKFANEDESHRDAPEYVAIQSGIDEVKGIDVFVIATANDIDKLPGSLIRHGRFDRKIEVLLPTGNDAEKIIRHYFENKKISEDVNLEDVSKMLSYSSCAELEAIINEAAINAAFARRETILMEDVVKAVLRLEYGSPDNYTVKSPEDLYKIALHEAGHLVVAEVLCPESIGLVSIRKSGRDRRGGFAHRCRELSKRVDNVLVCLGGKAAVELYFSESCASGCASDISRATKLLEMGVTENATHGFGLVDCYGYAPEECQSKVQTVVRAELEKCIFKAKDILIKNKAFLEKATELLVEKETLLFSDIKAIRESVEIINVAV